TGECSRRASPGADHVRRAIHEGAIGLSGAHSGHQLEESARAKLMLVSAWPAGNAPRASGRRADQAPAGGLERRAILALQDIRADAVIAEGEGRASCRAIEERAGVLVAVCAEPRHLKRVTVVSEARHRAADDHHADKITAQHRAEAELVADHRL